METLIRFFQPATRNFFLFGPRGTGKSTWLHEHFNSAHFIDLLAPDVYRFFSAKPERLITIANALDKIATIVIDEIQKVPELLDAVQLTKGTANACQFIEQIRLGKY